jgi:hypothetical protein
MTFTGGAGDYTLDFSGTLQRNASVQIDAGVSSLVIIVPKGASATVTVEGAVNSVRVDGSWVRSGDSYTLAGSGKTLTIAVTAGVGSVRLVEKRPHSSCPSSPESELRSQERGGLGTPQSSNGCSRRAISFIVAAYALCSSGTFR